MKNLSEAKPMLNPDANIVANLLGMTSDSRRVRKGWLFAALTGDRLDGRDYIEDALKRGAKAVLAQVGCKKPPQMPADTIWIEAPEPRRKLAQLASLYHAEKPQNVVAVTGTNGKTSSVVFLQQLWHASGITCASIGTLGLRQKNEEAEYTSGISSKDAKNASAQHASLTTPDPILLHELLAQLANNGVTHCALEASSHGLAQYRLDGLLFNAAILTNLSQDHLDYHKTWENYRSAKQRLFNELLAANASVVLPLAEPFAQAIEKEIAAAQNPISILKTHLGDTDDKRASISAFNAKIDEKKGSTRLSLRFATKDFIGQSQISTSNTPKDIILEQVEVPFVERFQINNLLGAITAFIALAMQKQNAHSHIKATRNTSASVEPAFATMIASLPAILTRLHAVRGRMQRFTHPLMQASVYVDFAHTPQALEVVLKEARRLVKASHTEKVSGRVLCLFGCGGDRDREKRPKMGAIAAELADRIYITDDNPRGEKAAGIRKAILQPLQDASKSSSDNSKNAPYYEIDDRKVAIKLAISDMQPRDVLIIAGKGHESGQIIGSEVRTFDDAMVVRDALNAIAKG